ncbi:MAG: response regulator [Pseudomonadota bacterium]
MTGDISPETKRILAVDDEIHMRIFLTTLFETNGFQIQVARDGREGMKIAREFRPHLIMLDVMMPGKGGVPMYRLLKTDPDLQNVPVVFLTGVAGESFSHCLKMISAGLSEPLPRPEGYLEKPPNPDQLLEVVRGLLGG